MRMRSAVAAASLLLVGAAGIVAVHTFWRTTRTHPLDQLVAAMGSDLDVEPRLSGGFRPSREHAVHRGPFASPPSLSPDARIAIARIEKDASINPTPRLLGALGVAYLIEDDLDRSIAVLEEATSVADDASTWSDLSAAYFVKADRVPARRIEHLARALEAASRSLKVASTAEARFNHALSSGRLAQLFGGSGSWADYVATEPDPGWRAAAQHHVSARQGSAKTSWEARRRQLRDRLDANDLDFVRESVAMFPERSFEFLDQELLNGWARAEISGETAHAGSELRQALALAQAIFRATQDRMPMDAIQAIQSLTASSARRVRELAEAHLAFTDGVMHFRADNFEAASRFNDRASAAFERTRSPYWAWAALQKAIVSFQYRDLDGSDRQLAAVVAYARQKNYPTLLGRTLRQQGLTRLEQWRLVDALAAFDVAATCFEAAGEFENAVATYSQIAAALRLLGERQTSWQYIGKTLDGLVHVDRPIQRYLALFNASLFASSQDLLEPALLFQTAALQEAMARGGGPMVEALIQRATILLRRGERDRALNDLNDARTRLATVPEGPPKRYEKAELDVLLAEVGAVNGQVTPTAELQDALTFFSTAEPAFVPRLRLRLARAHLAAHAIDETQAAFAQGIATLESQQSLLGDEALKLSYFDDSWGLFTEMIEFQFGTRHDLDAAFEYAERSRARALLARLGSAADTRPLRLSEIQPGLPPSTVLVYYVTLSDRVLIWTVTRSSSRMVESAVRRGDLGRLVSKHLSSLIAGAGRPSDAADRLYDLLIRPVGAALANDSTLVFVTDGDLQRLPFATLRNPSTSKYLVEDHPILAAPSATLFIEYLSRFRQLNARPIDSALLVGNPESGTQSAGLPSLPGALSEVAGAAAFYPRHEVLTGRGATKQRFMKSATDYDVVHFGGHAVVNVEYPLLSRLSFSPAGDSPQPEALFAHEISRMSFTHTRLVVLAACSTAAGPLSRGEGAPSVARPFLAAGVPVVVASHWDVDDRATEQLLLSFHRALSSTHDPARALRTATLACIHSNNPRCRRQPVGADSWHLAPPRSIAPTCVTDLENGMSSTLRRVWPRPSSSPRALRWQCAAVPARTPAPRRRRASAGAGVPLP